MALYHASMKNISRGSRNTVGALAYRTGCKLIDERGIDDQERCVFDYQDKEVEHVELLLPEGSSQWAQELQKEIREDRNTGIQHLCDKVEEAEIRKDARVYKELEFALPHELSKEQNIALAKEFLQDQVCTRGVGVLASFHCDQDLKTGGEKPHCHALFLTRRFEEQGLSCFKETALDKKELLLELREQVSAYTNFHLQMNGFEQRVDHRSYEDRGIELLPQPKMGRNVREMEKEGRISLSDRKITFEWVKQQNDELLRGKPEILLDLVGRDCPTFSRETLNKAIERYSVSDLTRNRLEDYIGKSGELLKVGSQEIVTFWGEVKDIDLYTTRTTQERERAIFRHLERLERPEQGWGDQKEVAYTSPLILCATKGQVREVLGEGMGQDSDFSLKALTFDDILKSPESLGLSPAVMMKDKDCLASLSSEKLKDFLDICQGQDLKTLMPWHSDQPLNAVDLMKERIPSLYPVFEQEVRQEQKQAQEKEALQKAQEQEKWAGYEKSFERILSFNKDYDLETLKDHIKDHPERAEGILKNELVQAFTTYTKNTVDHLREERLNLNTQSDIIDSLKKEGKFLNQSFEQNIDLVTRMNDAHSPLRSDLLNASDHLHKPEELSRNLHILQKSDRGEAHQHFLDMAKKYDVERVCHQTQTYCRDALDMMTPQERNDLAKEVDISDHMERLQEKEMRLNRDQMNQQQKSVQRGFERELER